MPHESDYVTIPSDVFGAFGVVSNECMFDCSQKALMLIGETVQPSDGPAFGMKQEAPGKEGESMDKFKDAMVSYAEAYQHIQYYREYCFMRFRNEGKELNNVGNLKIPSFGSLDGVLEDVMAEVLCEKFGGNFVDNVEGFGGFLSGSFAEKFRSKAASAVNVASAQAEKARVRVSNAKASASSALEKAEELRQKAAELKNMSNEERLGETGLQIQKKMSEHAESSNVFLPLFKKSHEKTKVKVNKDGSVLIDGKVAKGVILHTKHSDPSAIFPVQPIEPFEGVLESVMEEKHANVSINVDGKLVSMPNPPVPDVSAAAVQYAKTAGSRVLTVTQEALVNVFDKTKKAASGALENASALAETAKTKGEEVSKHIRKHASHSWGGVSDLQRGLHSERVTRQKEVVWNEIKAKLVLEGRTGVENAGLRALKEVLIDGTGDLSSLKRPSVIKKEIFNIFRDTTVWGVFGNSQLFTYMALWVEQWLVDMVFRSDKYVESTAAQYAGKNRLLSTAFWMRIFHSTGEFFLRSLIDFLKHPEFWGAVLKLLEVAKKTFCAAISVAWYQETQQSEWISSFMEVQEHGSELGEPDSSAPVGSDEEPMVDEKHKSDTGLRRSAAVVSLAAIPAYLNATKKEIDEKVPAIMIKTVGTLAHFVPGAKFVEEGVKWMAPGVLDTVEGGVHATASLITTHIKTQLEHWITQQLWVHNLHTLMSLLDPTNCFAPLYVNQNTNILYSDLFSSMHNVFEYGALKDQTGFDVGVKVKPNVHPKENPTGFVWGVVLQEPDPGAVPGLFRKHSGRVQYRKSFLDDWKKVPASEIEMVIAFRGHRKPVQATISQVWYHPPDGTAGVHGNWKGMGYEICIPNEEGYVIDKNTSMSYPPEYPWEEKKTPWESSVRFSKIWAVNANQNSIYQCKKGNANYERIPEFSFRIDDPGEPEKEVWYEWIGLLSDPVTMQEKKSTFPSSFATAQLVEGELIVTPFCLMQRSKGVLEYSAFVTSTVTVKHVKPENGILQVLKDKGHEISQITEDKETKRNCLVGQLTLPSGWQITKRKDSFWLIESKERNVKLEMQLISKEAGYKLIQKGLEEYPKNPGMVWSQNITITDHTDLQKLARQSRGVFE